MFEFSQIFEINEVCQNSLNNSQYLSSSSSKDLSLYESQSQTLNSSFILEHQDEEEEVIIQKQYQNDEFPEINLQKLKSQHQFKLKSQDDSKDSNEITFSNTITINYEKSCQQAIIKKSFNIFGRKNNIIKNLYQQKQSFTPEVYQFDKQEKGNSDNVLTQQAGIADFFQIKPYMKTFRNQHHGACEEIWAFLQQSFCQLNEKLNYMHKQQIIHGDIKPQNIVLSQEGSCYFIDFDLSIQLNDNKLSSSFIYDHLKHKTPFYNSQKLMDIIFQNEENDFLVQPDVLRLIDKMQLHLTFIYLICQSQAFQEYFKQKQIELLLKELLKCQQSTQKCQYLDDEQLIEIDQSYIESRKINKDQDYQQTKQNIQSSNFSMHSISNKQNKQQFIFVDEQMPLNQQYKNFVLYLFERYLLYEKTVLQELNAEESNLQRIEDCLKQNQQFISKNNYTQQNLFKQFVIGYKINPNQNDEIEVISLNRIFSFWLNYTEKKFAFNQNLVINEIINLDVLNNLKLKLKELCLDTFENESQKAEENEQNSALFYLYKQQFQQNGIQNYDINNNLELNNFIQALYLNPQMIKLSINVSKQHQMDSSLVKKLLQTLQILPNLKRLRLSLISQNFDNLFDDLEILFQKLEKFKIEVSTISQINYLTVYGFPNYCLKHLNISFLVSNITDKQLISIINVFLFCQLKTIKLNFPNCQSITDESITQLFQCFSQIQTLKTFNLNLSMCNQITQKSVNSLFDYLKQNRNVNMEIDFTDCSKIFPSNFDDIINYISNRSCFNYTLCIKYYFLTGNKEFKTNTKKISKKFEKVKFQKTSAFIKKYLPNCQNTIF
ncbi:hypothetical protein ABPG72_017455 [Tetrahymena utriculariae]